MLGRLRPRERLVEDELMARFGAKRHAVRAALAALDRAGLVTLRRHRGAAVREYGAEEIEELYAFPLGPSRAGGRRHAAADRPRGDGRARRPRRPPRGRGGRGAGWPT